MHKRTLFAVLFAALVIAVRLPFLIAGKIAFDSDEAVEGLMARHVLSGEFPVFYWGQPFKGVPEAYVTAVVFALFGSSVAALKSVTLMFFAVYVALNFILLERIASRWLAIAASLLLIASPPALVFFNLDARAEYALIMMLGTVLLLLYEKAKDGEPGARGPLFAAGLVVGVGLWAHQLFIWYLLPLSLILLLRSDWWTRRELGTATKGTRVLAALAGVYLVLGLIAFTTGGFSFRLGSIGISATAPQKMARIGLGIGLLAVIIHVLTNASSDLVRRRAKRYWPAAAGFLGGYSPVLLYSIFVEPARTPARVANLRDVVNAMPDIVGNIVPILAGFKTGTTERIAVPVIAAVPGVAALAAYVWSTRRRLMTDFFPLFVVIVPALFLVSGAYLDTQSYRYLIPWYAGLTVAWAAGSLTVAQMVRLKPDTTYFLASAIVALIVAVHAWQQVLWYQKLQPDTQSLATIECLKRQGIKGGYAEYWTAYKLTFLAQEEIIIAPTDGVDRYPRYTEYVRSLPPHQQVRLKADTTDCN